MSGARAIAHPNIALAKYWGKRPGVGNVPAVPSLSVTLAGLATITTVSPDQTLTSDRIVLNGRELPEAEAARIVVTLDALRKRSGNTARAEVRTDNDFPTASGLASSASGFAALVTAGAAAYGLTLSETEACDLVCQGSASATRSLYRGFVEFVPGSVARSVADPSALDVRVLVCVTTEAKKTISSRDGMERTRALSPYYSTWLEEAPRIFHALRAALALGDLATVGTLTERSALAMHASAMAAGAIYFSGATIAAYERVVALRGAGARAWATMDAGPHVKVLVASAEAAEVQASLEAVPGVLRVLCASPGEGARLL